MAHPIPAPKNPIFKKGDRVQHADSGIFGTVYQDQTDPLLVHLNWDKYPGQIECYKSDAVRVAPWHEINIMEVTLSDKDAATVLADLLERRNADIPKLEKKLADENAEYEVDPHPLTARIIEITVEKVVRARLEAEAISVALKKF